MTRHVHLSGALFLSLLAGAGCKPSPSTAVVVNTSVSLGNPVGAPQTPPSVVAGAKVGPGEAAPSRLYVRPDESTLRERLSRIQFEVTQHEATEPPFRNEFYNNHAAGIYVDVVTGEPLFSSTDKFESGTGWPSFTRPIEDGRVVSRTDSTLGMERTEVRSRGGSSHLGHVFDDGPPPGGLRYCINSASLRFIPVDRLAAEGYGAYAKRFTGAASAPPPDATNNACAMPPPGDKPGCEATLETEVLEGDPENGVKALRAVDGVLDAQPESRGRLRVTYDPKRIARADLVGKWVALGGRRGSP